MNRASSRAWGAFTGGIVGVVFGTCLSAFLAFSLSDIWLNDWLSLGCLAVFVCPASIVLGPLIGGRVATKSWDEKNRPPRVVAATASAKWGIIFGISGVIFGLGLGILIYWLAGLRSECGVFGCLPYFDYLDQFYNEADYSLGSTHDLLWVLLCISPCLLSGFFGLIGLLGWGISKNFLSPSQPSSE